MTTNVTRRGLIAFGMGLAGATALGVGSASAYELVCANPDVEAKRKRAVHYTEKTPDPAKDCDGCLWYESRDDCGNCRILSTKVNPDGYCDSWSARKK
jgi:hypothetical protein